ncbi:TPA: hypothetical protein L6B76_29390, partial [Pseudomonas aeruginosa]|nr:hypothetical protein [Pseudomonas aeruginosa]
MSYFILQRHASEQIVLTANPDVSDEDLIRHIRDQGIAVCVTRTGRRLWTTPGTIDIPGLRLDYPRYDRHSRP